jgi:GNAT superfamily N-acetyltransferase
MPRIREARPEDAIAVAELHIRAWQAAYRGLLPDDFLDRLDVEERASRYSFGSAEPGAPQTILATFGERIGGFATIGPSRDDDAPGMGEIYALYVEPRSWRGGVGRLLLEEARGRLRERGFEEAILWVLVGNEGAARFYLADGWRPDGAERVEDPYGVVSRVARYRRGLEPGIV